MEYKKIILDNKNNLKQIENLIKDIKNNNISEQVIFDFSNINYIKSEILGSLLSLNQYKNLKWGIININENISRVLKLTQVDTIIKIFNSKEKLFFE